MTFESWDICEDCTPKLQERLAWAKNWRNSDYGGPCSDCGKCYPLFNELAGKAPFLCKDCLLSRAFGVIEK